ncbi:hypothetical protein NM119_003312 [Vibrio cholerae]|nr:hypothetical protein [Vibrio cholerae]
MEYITSPIIPISVSSGSGRKIILLCDFDFSHESLSLVYNLARKLCAEFSNHYEIYFRNYNKLKHDPVVDEVQMAANSDSDEDIELVVGSYNKNFRNELNGK